MSRIAFVSDEPISFPRLIDTEALLRGLQSFATTCHNCLRRMGRYLAMWYL
jgi:hypothetical protein